jgi:hypothetical protein
MSAKEAVLAGSFPDYQDQIDELVRQHAELQDEPLLLAIYYAPPRDPEHLFLFEVHEGFGRNQVDASRELFEVTYGSTSGFPLPSGVQLHLILTNPPEFRAACEQDWPKMRELRDAVRRRRAAVLHQTDTGSELLECLHGRAS